MTTSFSVDLSSDGPYPIVSSSYYPQPNPDTADFKRNHRPQEVLIMNSTDTVIYLGTPGGYYDNTGLPLLPGSGISLSLGSGDDLFGWADGSVTIPVLILDGKGR